MIQSIAIKAYFAQMRNFFTRQGFDQSMKVAYGADAEGPQRLLDQDIANKKMNRKSETDRETVREDPYSFLFWTRDSLKNIVRRSVRIADGKTPDGKLKFKKTVSASFGMGCVLVSNKAELIEDFSEAFAAEYQNLHNVPINLKFAYEDRETPSAGGYNTAGLNATIIQELGSEELVSFRQGNLFSYSWNINMYLQFVSEFANWEMAPLRSIVVDLYNPNGVPLASMDFNGVPEWTVHTATDGTQVVVPASAYVETDVLTESKEDTGSDDGSDGGSGT